MLVCMFMVLSGALFGVIADDMCRSLVFVVSNVLRTGSILDSACFAQCACGLTGTDRCSVALRMCLLPSKQMRAPWFHTVACMFRVLVCSRTVSFVCDCNSS